eukprot:CAMPEP_0185528970 /NCGR_PEP_ID=MMETSP1366-20130426/100161_1 /TAXON_ID=38817 /ORGANISM="Gephyrocapsa oceanica, Strain RCC1303" /LENGTH=411 /DNA_ID=CAMNT_0028140549 /DNA_START=220 /DNA_END=1456 /DNA_ORIENTATION=+
MENYKAHKDADVLIWHEGNFDSHDLDILLTQNASTAGTVNARLCLLDCCSGWGPPPHIRRVPRIFPRGLSYALGYLYMIRFFGITAWPTLDRLGYQTVMRMDDDSNILSSVQYNIFDYMRQRQLVYGYRLLTRMHPRFECPLLGKVFARLPFLAEEKPVWQSYCNRVTGVGYYNNWFVSDVRWWLGDTRRALRRAFDDAAVIFTDRLGDIVIQSVAVQTLLAPTKRLHFLDFTYEHTTVRRGVAVCGGLDVGYNDDDAPQHITSYLQRFPQQEATIRVCVAPKWDESRAATHTLQIIPDDSRNHNRKGELLCSSEESFMGICAMPFNRTLGGVAGDGCRVAVGPDSCSVRLIEQQAMLPASLEKASAATVGKSGRAIAVGSSGATARTTTSIADTRRAPSHTAAAAIPQPL